MTQKQITTTSNKKIKLEDKIVFSCPYQRDLSPLFFISNSNKKFIKVAFSYLIFISDNATKRELDQTRKTLLEKHANKNVHLDYKEKWTIPGFKSNVIHLNVNNNVNNNSSQKTSFLTSMTLYLLSSLFLLNFLFRFYFDHLCDKQEYQFIKEISKYPLPEIGNNYNAELIHYLPANVVGESSILQPSDAVNANQATVIGVNGVVDGGGNKQQTHQTTSMTTTYPTTTTANTNYFFESGIVGDDDNVNNNNLVFQQQAEQELIRIRHPLMN
ncbi:hypothetical protein ABK040_000789 [Willaertia magna]